MIDKSLNYLFHEILEKVLHLSDNPAHFTEYLSLQIRELVGARTILIAIQDENKVSKIFSVYPLRRNDWAHQPAIFELIDLSFCHSKIEIWNKFSDNEIVANSLNVLDAEKAISIPLIVAEKVIGSILLLDIMDKYGIEEVMKVLSDLSGVFALIVRNSVLYTNLEHQVENRTAELKKRNEELEESETKYRELVENSPDAIAIYTAKKLVFVNKECLSLMGAKSKSELLGMHVIEFVHPDYREFVAARMKNALLKQEVLPLAEEKFIRLDGTPRDVDVKAFPINFEGQPAVQIIVRDISERKSSEKALAESEEKFRNIFESASVGKSITMPNGKLNVNQAFCEMIGYSPEEMANLKWQDIIYKDDFEKGQSAVNSVLAGESTNFRIEERFVHKNGEIIWVDISSTLQLGNDSTPLYFISTVINITDRKRAEKTLNKSQKLLSETEKIGNVGGWEYYYDSGKLNWTEETYNIHELTFNKNVTLDAGINFYTPESIPIINLAVQQAIKFGVPFDLELEIITIKGNLRAVHTIGKIDRDHRRIHGFFQDITDRKKAQQTLIESEERFRMAIVNSPFPIMLHAEDGKVELINDEWIKVTGYSIQDIPTTALWTEKAYGFRKEMVRDDIEKLYSITEKNDEGEYLITTKTGESRNWFFSSIPLGKTPDGRRLVLSMAIDITERRKAEIKLLKSEKKLSSLFSSMTEMVVMHELILDELTNAIDYRILDCNDIFTSITGIQRQDAIGKLATEVYQTLEAPHIRAYANVVITGESYVFDTYSESMDKYFIISAVSIGENMFATIATDISEIQNAQKELKEKNQELENYIYVASHDLRSPLVNIQGFSQRLEKQTEKLNAVIADGIFDETKKLEISKITLEDVPKSLNFILNNVAKMDTLINGLLYLSRTGRIVLNVNKIDVNKLVNDVIKSFNYQLTECNAQLDIPHLSDCYGDVNQLNQVFSNIIGNAIKYKDSNRKLEIEITSKVEVNRVRYSIKDNGMGINTRQLEKIWDIFYRVDASSPEAGEGLGLSLARRIVEKHKGKIWAESEINVGSIFHIELQKNYFE